MEKEIKMTNQKVLGYGIGSLGKDLALGVIGSYLLIFYTNVLGITAAAAGTILVITKIWDAINDPIMGAIVDRTNTRWGRFRPYLLFVPVPLAIFSALCFVAPDWPYTAKVIYALVTYTITGMLFTAYDVPLWGMVPSITSSGDESNKCISAARWFTSLGMLLATSIAYPLIEALGGGSETENLRAGYPKFMILIGIASVLFALITFASTKERSHEKEEAKKGNAFVQLFEVIKEKNVRIVFFTMVLQAVAMILPNVAGTYYVIYYIGQPNLIAIYFLVTGAVGLLSAPAAALVLKRVSAGRLTVFAMTASIMLSILAFFIPAGQIVLLFAVLALYGFFMPIPMVSITTLLVESGNEIYEKTGQRKDGTLFSLNSFAIKCGTALASGIISVVLAVTQFKSEEFIQSQAVLTGLNLTRTIMCAVIYVIAILIVRNYEGKEA